MKQGSTRRTREHSLPDVSSVCGLVAGASTTDEGDLRAFMGRVVHDWVEPMRVSLSLKITTRTFVCGIKSKLGIDSTEALEGIYDQGIGLVQEVLGCICVRLVDTKRRQEANLHWMDMTS